jgi:UDP-N-acetylmuramoyl-tripeptide--D-alanyl-D-alanine ligase
MMTEQYLWQAEDVVRVVHARCLHEQTWAARGVSIDSRTVARGDLFIALQGPTHDGHDHVGAAFAAGAAAALVSRQPSQVPPDAPLVFVDDTMSALQALGHTGRARAKGKIIAVTGSVGKTSTKEMLRLALGAVGHTFANTGSYNNHWGVPLSLANLPPDAEYGVFELGMNHAGELTALSQMARPDIAIVTTVEAVHLEFFASTEAIADAKAEIFQGMNENGTAILNRDNPHYNRLAAAAKNCGIKKILSFGRDAKSDATREGCAVNATIRGYNIHYSIGAPGSHLVQNSLGALLAASVAGRNIDACAGALAHYKPPKGRGGTTHVNMTVGGILTVIDESYNASPVSVRAAIKVLSQVIPTAAGRRILVLGDMRELGETSPALHAELATEIVEGNIDSVFCCGEMMRYLYDALPPATRGAYASDSAKLAAIVAQAVRADDVVTIKGSKSMEMGRIIDVLKSLDVAQPRKIAS